MVLEIIRYLIAHVIAHGQENQFETDYGKAAGYLDASTHSLGYMMFRSGKETNRYIMMIEWDSVEGHLEGFRKSPEFGKFFALVKPYFDMIEEMEHYQRTSVIGGTATGGEQ